MFSTQFKLLIRVRVFEVENKQVILAHFVESYIHSVQSHDY